jgi:hypothetical protein
LKWGWTQQAKLAFWRAKWTSTEALILRQFDQAKSIILPMDSSGFPIAGIFNPCDCFGDLRPVNFYSQKHSLAEQNYYTSDQELLAIVETLKQWRHCLGGANHKVLLWCTQKNLQSFQTSKILSRRQVRWSETHSACDFVIKHLEGIKNFADSLSRCPDDKIGYRWPVPRLFVTVTVELHHHLIPAIMMTQASDSLAADVSAKVVDWPTADSQDTTGIESQ